MNSNSEQDAAPARALQPSTDSHDTSTPALDFEDDSLPTLARRAVESFVLERRLFELDPASLSPLLRQPAACFVSLKTFERELRGCIGTIKPARNTLAEEIVVNAVSAATRDPRFPPVAAEELSRLRYSVDVLGEPEPTSFEDLDPATFGVIVEDESGSRRGLLLPHISGVETAGQQVQIASRKAGIALHQPHRLYRFRVRRFTEGMPAQSPQGD